MPIAIILARAGSKRIPSKNITPFLGKPLLAHVIERASNLGLFDQIIVSTDDPKIAQIAQDHGALTPFLRPTHLADDNTPTLEVLAHAIQTLNLPLESLVCGLYGTSVLLQKESLERAFLALKQNPNKKYAFACSAYSASPYRAFSLEHNTPAPLFPPLTPKRSPRLPPRYYHAGACLLRFFKAFLQLANPFAPPAIPHSLPTLDNPAIYKPAGVRAVNAK
ncbi:cytidylyltransferase domain-containing protein [Helicobacter bizzozeronii]|uniref:cytidylyltransferase domain-containing protein n=1 Tax=Helicobacter bizzozeronii TaxID=56877 RepID=UPI001F2322E8|nr:pseudaminic acid cytidylyltransferase [Helicobacter bizzozeronii]